MAKLTGTFGAFSGKVGNVVGCVWRGVPYIRTRPSLSRNRKPTPRQQIQRARFHLANQFVRNFRNLIKISFQAVPGQSERNMALSHILRYAVIGTYPNFSIDYSQVLVAKGNLKKALDPIVTASGPGKLTFTWKNNADDGNALTSDKVIMIVYNEEEDAMIFKCDDAAVRAKERAEFEFRFFSGKEVHVWISFRSWESPFLVAESCYLGKVMVN